MKSDGGESNGTDQRWEVLPSRVVRDLDTTDGTMNLSSSCQPLLPHVRGDFMVNAQD